SVRRDGILIQTARGRSLLSTPEHVHFAGVAQQTSRIAGGLLQLALSGGPEARDRVTGTAYLGNDQPLPCTDAADVRPGMRLVDEGVSRAEIAVFYRTNAQSRVLEDALVRAEIAYQVIGGTKFYERAEIKDAIAYLTVLINPQDVGAFTRIVNSPRRGIGST